MSINIKYNEATHEIEASFKYDLEIINKLKQIPNVRWNPESKTWIIPDLMFQALEDRFKGEIVYMTPKWEITGEAPPDYSKIYAHIQNKPVNLKPPYSPYPFQAFGANFLVEQAKRYKFACLFDDMGTGKTLMSIAGAMILNNEMNLLKYTIPILVVCKSGLKYQWVTDGINKFTDATSIVIDGTKAKRKKIYDSIKKMKPYEYVVIGYETLREDAELLKNIDIGLIISDEAHKVRNHETQANKAMCKLKAEYKFFLTGSPISGEPDGMFGLGTIGDKKFFGTWNKFKDKFLVFEKTRYGLDKVGCKNLDILKEDIDKVSLRRTDKEIAMQMPKIISQDIKIEMSGIQRAIDEAIQQDCHTLNLRLETVMSTKDPVKRTQERQQLEGALKGMMNLRVGAADSPELFQLSNSPAVRNKYGAMVNQFNNKSGKLEYLKEHVKEIVESGNKVVIFTKFETMVRIMFRELSKIKNIGDIATFTGQMSALDKENSRIKFKTSSTCNIFIATNAGAEG